MGLQLTSPSAPSGGLKGVAKQAPHDFAGAAYTVAIAGAAFLAVSYVWSQYVKPKLGGAAHQATNAFGEMA
jgi:hypothetical protein